MKATEQNQQPVVIVGAGFYGAVMAERFASAGRRVLVLDKRPHIGGNSWSRPDPETGVEEHMYGPHIFHTSDETVWEYANRFTTFNGYRHTVWARRRGKIYSLPVAPPEDAAILAKYRAEAAAICPDTVFGGRLGRYAYWDMDKAIAVALADYQKLSSGAPGGIRE